MPPRAFRHFDRPALDNIPWDDPRVVIIEIKKGKPNRYASDLNGKLDLLQGRATLLVAWPGEHRQDVFEMDKLTRHLATIAIAETLQHKIEPVARYLQEV